MAYSATMDMQHLAELSDDDKWRLVYEIWASDGEQSDEKTAEISGIPRRTIAYHRNKEQWSSRYKTERIGLSHADVDVARIRWKRLLVNGMARMEEIVYGKVQLRDQYGKPVYDDDGSPVMTWAADHGVAIRAYQAIMDSVTNRDMGSLATDIEGTVLEVGAGAETIDPALRAAQILEEHQYGVNTRITAQAKRGKRK